MNWRPPERGATGFDNSTPGRFHQIIETDRVEDTIPQVLDRPSP